MKLSPRPSTWVLVTALVAFAMAAAYWMPRFYWNILGTLIFVGLGINLLDIWRKARKKDLAREAIAQREQELRDEGHL